MEISEIRKYCSDFEEKAKKYELSFQLDGRTSSRRTADKYRDLVDICILAEKEKTIADEDKLRRKRNAEFWIGRWKEAVQHSGQTDWSMEDVEKLLQNLADTVV